MNPTQPQPGQPQPPASPQTYLDQIAPHTSKKQLLKPGPRLLIFIGALLVLLMIILAVTVNIVTTNQRRPLQQLAARLTATSTVTEKAKANLKSSQLRSLNSNLSLYLTDTNGDVGAPLLAAGVNTSKISDSITKSETDEANAIIARLEEARLNVAYDTTYAREMAHQLETLMILMKQIYSSTSNVELKTFLTNAYTNLEPTQKAFADFNPRS